MTDVQELLERDVPLRTELAPDWEDVVARARPRRWGRLPLAAAGLAAAAAAAFAAVALWPAGGGSVLERALAAVGDGPVIHVVYRSDVHETLVDLRTADERPVWFDEEEWYEPGVGVRHVERIDGRATGSSVQPASALTPEQRQTYGGIFDGYRDALAHGDARLAGADRVAGHDVYWIAFTPEQLPDVADGRTHSFGVEVAVDRATYRPVSLRYLRDGVPGPGTGSEILTLDTVAAGSVDLTPSAPTAPEPFLRGTLEPRTASPAAAPLDPGTTLAGRKVGEARTVTYEYGHPGSPQRAAGFELCYGTSAPGAGCDGIFVQETTAPQVFVPGPGAAIAPPDGSMLVDETGTRAVLRLGSLYVHLSAGSHDELAAAAQALYEAKTSR